MKTEEDFLGFLLYFKQKNPNLANDFCNSLSKADNGLLGDFAEIMISTC